MKSLIPKLIIIILIFGAVCFVVNKVDNYYDNRELRAAYKQIDQRIESLIEARKSIQPTEDEDPFGENDLVRILLLGIDSRAGEENGHCDAIQMIEINRRTKAINITAVPRGTPSPLPGTGHLPTDYYIAKSCEIGGLEYGIKQVEWVLGQKADYVAMVGFSEAIGIFRHLDLETTETLQWLRNRQAFAIGEPQRAHNHSTFIKQMIIKFAPKNGSSLDTAWQYLVYKLINTDLSFTQVKSIADAISTIEPENYPDRIALHMKPSYEVQDIAYDEENPGEQVKKLLGHVPELLSEADYSDESLEEIQKRLIKEIKSNLSDPAFVDWAYANNLWLQIEDEEKREDIHFKLVRERMDLLDDSGEKELLLTEYIIEMTTLGLKEYEDDGKKLLLKLQNSSN